LLNLLPHEEGIQVLGFEFLLQPFESPANSLAESSTRSLKSIEQKDCYRKHRHGFLCASDRKDFDTNPCSLNLEGI
ncbi:unnamed protein product, partial [Musa acuminata subsp. burmannicoides]